MRERRWVVPFLDLSNVLFFFFCALFAVALIVIGDEQTKAKVESTSRFIVTMTWTPDGSRDDIDLSVKVPSGEIVFYRTRQAAFASLDRDDLGLDSNTVVADDGTVISLKTRSEIIYIRQTIPGVYTFNVHAYSKKEAAPAHVLVTLTSVGDRTQVLQSRQITLSANHEERTAFRMTVDADGNAHPDLVEELFINEALGEAARPNHP